MQRFAHHVQLERRHRQLGHQVHLCVPHALLGIFLRQDLQLKHAVRALVLARTVVQIQPLVQLHVALRATLIV